MGIWGAERLPIVRAAEYYPPYACSVVQSITELAIAGAYDGLDGVLISCLCDTQMRHAEFPPHLPQREADLCQAPAKPPVGGGCNVLYP